MAILRSRNAQGTRIGDRLGQEIDKRAVDRRVLDAAGREEKLHDDCGPLIEFGSRAKLAVTIR
jgi:hypothetical protein